MLVVGTISALGCDAASSPSYPVVQEDRPVDCDGLLPDCWTSKLGIADVARDGDRIGILVLQEGGQLVHLYLSEDRGGTWRRAAIGGDLLYNHAWSTRHLQLLLRGGYAWLLLETAEPAGGGVAERLRLAAFDLEAGTLRPADGSVWLPSGVAEMDDRGHIAVVYDSSDIRGGPASRNAFHFYLDTFTAGPDHRLCEGDACASTWFAPRRAGVEWQAYGVVGQVGAVPGRACRFAYRFRDTPDSPTPWTEESCVSYAQWPPGQQPFRRQLYATGSELLYELYAEEGRAFAIAITSATSTTPATITGPIALGPGEPEQTAGLSLRERMGGFAQLSRRGRQGTRSTLVRMLADGTVEEVDVPPYPCSGPCGDPLGEGSYGALHWLEPLGGEDFLAVWVVDRDARPTFRHEAVYAGLVRATYAPARLDAEGPDAGVRDAGGEPSPFPAYPDARRSSDLVRACQAVELCGLGAFDRCLTTYGTNTFVAPARGEHRRDALIAALAGGCEGLRAALPPPGCDDRCLTAGGICTEAGGCDLGAPVDRGLCAGRAVGSYCAPDARVVGCNSAGAATVIANCPGAELSCVDATTNPMAPMARCALLECSETPVCEGSLATSCTALEHCEDRAQRCSEGRCVSEGAAGCVWGSTPPVCEGDYALHCLGNHFHYQRCSDLGFAGGCTSGGGELRCAP